MQVFLFQLYIVLNIGLYVWLDRGLALQRNKRFNPNPSSIRISASFLLEKIGWFIDDLLDSGLIAFITEFIFLALFTIPLSIIVMFKIMITKLK